MRQLKKSLVTLILLLGTHTAFGFECVTSSSGLQTCAANIFRPSSIDEIKSIVDQAILHNKKIRAIGGLHSDITDVVVGSENYLVSTERLDKILEIDIENQTVKAQAGVNLHTLSLQLAKLGLQLVDQPGPFDATVAGMVANGSHESGRHGCVSDSVVALELIDGHGKFRVISDDSHQDWLPAARVSLGVLGIIYSVTFQCYPTAIRNVVATVETADKEFIHSIPAMLQENDNFQFLINPYSKKALKQTFNIVNDACTNNTLRNFGHYLSQSQIVGEMNTIVNPNIPVNAYHIVNNAIIESGITDVREFFYKGYSFFHDNQASRARLVEISVNGHHITRALRILFDLVDQHKDHGAEFITFAEIRYVHDTNFTYLSPTRSDRPSWLIGLILIFPSDNKKASNLLRDLSDALKESPFDGRPSWGNNPEFLTFSDTEKLYGAKHVRKFNHIRRELDPKGIFYTEYFQERLGPQ